MMFHSFSIIFLLATLISILNYKWLKLPSTIGGLIIALVFASFLIMSQWVYEPLYEFSCELILESDFAELLLDVMLGFLLFAGAVHIDLRDLLAEKKNIIAFSSLAVLLSTALFGGLFYAISHLLNFSIPLAPCLLLGAIVSPTDPIAVLSILNKAKVSKSLEMKIEGESLFNDGFGVVVFTALLLFSSGSSESGLGQEVVWIFVQEALGGLLFGLLVGYLMKLLLEMVREDSELSVMVTIAGVMGSYAIAHTIGVSGPLATVVLGIYIGNYLNCTNFPIKTKKIINTLWKVIDESLNTILFVLIGLTVHLIEWNMLSVALGLISIVIILVARYLSVLVPFQLLNFYALHKQRTMTVLTWGALRGGISLALVLSLPESEYKSLFVAVVFMIVIFSIIVQGLTIGKLVKRLKL